MVDLPELYTNTIFLYPESDSFPNIIERLNDRDGAQMEGPMYAMVAVGRTLPLGEALKRYFSVDYLNTSEIQTRLSKMNNWLAYELLPVPNDCTYFNNINDSDLGSGMAGSNANGLMSNVLALTAYYNTPVSRWLFENTLGSISNIQTSPGIFYQRFNRPESNLMILLKYNTPSLSSPSALGFTKSKHFADRGLVYVRTSDTWADNNDIQFGFEGSPVFNPANNIFSVKHDQADKNHFTLHAFGEKLIIDYGYGDLFYGKRPESHNYIMIDNKGQAIGTYYSTYRSQWEADWLPRNGKIVTHMYNGKHTFIHGDAKDAFSTLHFIDGNGEPLTVTTGNENGYDLSSRNGAYVNPVEKADRYVHFNQPSGDIPAYVVIADDISKDNTNSYDYDFLFHTLNSTSGTNPVTIGGTLASAKIWNKSYSAPSFSSTSVSQPIQRPGPLDDEMEYSTSSISSYSNKFSVNAVNPYFHTIIYPYKSGMPTPTVSYPTTSGGSTVLVEWSGYNDYSLFKYTTGTVSASNIYSDAKLLMLRKTSGGSIVSYAVGNGSSVTDNGTTLLETFGVVARVMYSGSDVLIEGENIADYRVYAPNATSVKVNGTSVNFIQAGNYVEPTTLSNSRTWSGTILINNNTTLNSGSTLTISSGSTVRLASGVNLTANGNLSINGSSSIVTFTTPSGTGSAGSWGSFIMSGSGSANSSLDGLLEAISKIPSEEN
jgi:hypothetical protein